MHLFPHFFLSLLTKTQIDRVQDQERQDKRACIEAYKGQLIMGRHFFARAPGARVEMVYARDSRIVE